MYSYGTMEQLSPALVTVVLATLGALGALVERIRRDLSENTQITKEAKRAADGQLGAALNDLAAERNRTLALREIIREREDRIAYIVARHPEAEATMRAYGERRTRRVTAADERSFERATLAEDEPGQPGSP